MSQVWPQETTPTSRHETTSARHEPAPRGRLARWRRRVTSSPFARDLGRLVSGAIVAQILALAAAPLLTRVFGPEDFAVFGALTALSTILATFTTLRLDIVIPSTRRRVDALRLSAAAILASALGALLTALVVAFFGDWIAEALSFPDDAAAALWTAPPMVFGVACVLVGRAWCVRAAAFAAIGRAQIARAALAILAALALAALGFGVAGAALALGQSLADFAFVAIAALGALVVRDRAALLRWDRRRLEASFARHGRLIRAVFGSQILATLYQRAPILAIAAAFGPIEAGYYALCERVAGAPSALFASALGDVYRQRAAVLHHAGAPFDQLMRRSFAVGLALSVGPFLAAIALTPQLFGLVFGAAWAPASFTMMALLAAALVTFNTQPFDKAAVIVGDRRHVLQFHGLRFALEMAAAAAALASLLSYENYLIALVASRAALGLWTLTHCHKLATGWRPAALAR